LANAHLGPPNAFAQREQFTEPSGPETAPAHHLRSEEFIPNGRMAQPQSTPRLKPTAHFECCWRPVKENHILSNEANHPSYMITERCITCCNPEELTQFSCPGK
jgi:hypothetical protein